MAGCHSLAETLKLPAGARKIVLAGNPNVGKSVFFNTLTGMYVDVSNYPGTTLEIAHGYYGADAILDTPGVYGLASFNDEEQIARDIILEADLVINIVDAVHLERDLFLTRQLIDMGLPMVVALNMFDEAERSGLAVDYHQLEKLLGVPVIPTIATRGWGLEDLKRSFAAARPGRPDPSIQQMLASISGHVSRVPEALLVLEGDPDISRRNAVTPGERQEEIYLRRREWVNDLVSQVVTEKNTGSSWATRLGRLMIRPVTGIPLLLVTLWLVYQMVGVFIAQTVVGITEDIVMLGYYEPWIRSLVSNIVQQESLVGTILTGEFGVLTMTVTYVLGLLMPLVAGFYFVLAVLEDTGYLPRIAVLVDRALTTIGLNGRAVIPAILGFGCVTMATITTRMLGSDRERKIATFLLALAIPCSAQLAVIASLLARLGASYFFWYAGIIFVILVVVGTVLNRILPGKSTDLLIDLPPLRLPRLANIGIKTYIKTTNFIKEAAPLFAVGALLISLLQAAGMLTLIQKWLAPMTIGWLQLPQEAATAFIMGFVRRDFGAAGLYQLTLSPEQTLVALVTITIFVPCIASAMVIFKERGTREALIIWPTVLLLAFIIGGILSQIII